jgi:hypothetical protein
MFGIALLIGMFLAFLSILPLFAVRGEGRNASAITIGCVFLVIDTLVAYFGMPSIAYPLLGTFFILVFLGWITSATAAWTIYSEGGKGMPWLPTIIAILGSIILIGSGIAGWKAWGGQAHTYAKLIGEMDNKTKIHWSQDQQPIDPAHIRLVTYDLAISLAATSLSDTSGHTLGSQYVLDEQHITLQKIKDDYFYLIPVDFANFWRWMQTDCVRDYVKVSATDIKAKPELVKTSQKIKYTFTACFGNNIERKLYKKYYNYVLEDFTFEEDDNGKVWWTVSATQPSIAWSAPIVKGVILFDPETGEDTFISKKDIDAGKYAWIDRVMPKHIIGKYLDLWGEYKDGWTNSCWWGKKNNLMKAETPVMNYSVDGRCVYVTPVASINSDQTMVGLVYTDARTGKSVFYTTEGGQTESSIQGTVETSIKNYPNWYASEQIVYENIYGEMCALVPVLAKDQNGHANFQELAIVSTKNKFFSVGKTPTEALQAFVKNLMSGSQLSTESTIDYAVIRDVVWRIGTENNIRYIQFKNMKRVIALNTSNTVEIAMTKEGDSVEVKYINSNESALPSIEFRNITNPIELSKNQDSVQMQIQRRIVTEKNKATLLDAKSAIDTLSDSEKVKLYEQMKKNKKSNLSKQN